MRTPLHQLSDERGRECQAEQVSQEPHGQEPTRRVLTNLQRALEGRQTRGWRRPDDTGGDVRGDGIPGDDVQYGGSWGTVSSWLLPRGLWPTPQDVRRGDDDTLRCMNQAGETPVGGAAQVQHLQESDPVCLFASGKQTCSPLRAAANLVLDDDRGNLDLTPPARQGGDGSDRRPGETELGWLQRLFPGQQWDEPPHANVRTRLPHRPPVLGLTKPNTIIAQGVRFYEPVKWYLEQLLWEPHGEKTMPTNGGTTWVELALDFYAATHVALTKPGQQQAGPVAEQAKLFAVIAKRVAYLSKGTPSPCKAMPFCGALAPYGFSWTAGFRGEAALLHRTQVHTLLARRQAAVSHKPKSGQFQWEPKWGGLLPPRKWAPHLDDEQVVDNPPANPHNIVIPIGNDPQAVVKCSKCGMETVRAGLTWLQGTACKAGLADNALPDHDLDLPPDLEAPGARAVCKVCGASALTKKRAHGGSGLDNLRGTRCRGALRGAITIREDPLGLMSKAEREEALRARRARQQREYRAQGKCLNKPEHRAQQARKAKADRQAKKSEEPVKSVKGPKKTKAAHPGQLQVHAANEHGLAPGSSSDVGLPQPSPTELHAQAGDPPSKGRKRPRRRGCNSDAEDEGEPPRPGKSDGGVAASRKRGATASSQPKSAGASLPEHKAQRGSRKPRGSEKEAPPGRSKKRK